MIYTNIRITPPCCFSKGAKKIVPHPSNKENTPKKKEKKSRFNY